MGKTTAQRRKTGRGTSTFTDITERTFGELTAMYPTEKREKNGSVIWHCRCSCGNEKDVSYNRLLYTNQRSCGCKKKEHNRELQKTLTHTCGTSIDMLKSRKVPTDNTTGYRGVYFIRGKYVAKIVFQKKAYYFGTYENIEDAAKARKDAEEILFGETIRCYKKWEEKAKQDPAWAEENPVKISVNVDEKRKIHVVFEPLL